MLRGLRWVCLLLGLALVVPLFAADDPKKTDKPDSKAAPKEKLIYVGQMSGMVGWMDGGSRVIRLQVPGGGGPVELQGSDDVKVRVLKPPSTFDEKGNIRKPTSKDLDKLKGEGADRKLPGYTSDFDSVKQGATVQVYVYRRPGTNPQAKANAPGKDKNALAQDRLLFTTLVILQPAPN